MIVIIPRMYSDAGEARMSLLNIAMASLILHEQEDGTYDVVKSRVLTKPNVSKEDALLLIRNLVEL